MRRPLLGCRDQPEPDREPVPVAKRPAGFLPR